MKDESDAERFGARSMTFPLEPAGAAPTRPLAPSLAFAAGILAAAITLAACLETASVRDLEPTRWIGAAILFALASFSGRSAAHGVLGRTGLRLAAASLVAFGAVETPAWVSIDTFGISVASSWLALAALALFYALERGLHDASAGTLALVVFSAFGGPFFVRDGDDFHALHSLLAIAALASVPVAGAPRRLGVATFVLVFLVVLALPLVPAVDRDRHLEGFLRACAAFAPLPLCAALAAEREAASRAIARAWIGVSLLGVFAAAAAVIEGGLRFDLGHALRVRLPLFGEHPNIVAPFFAVSVPLLVAIARAGKSLSGAERILALLVACGATGALALTRSRAAAGGLALAVALLVALAVLRTTRGWFRSGARITAVSALAIGVLAVGGWLGFDFIAAKLADSSMRFRVYMWETAAAAIADRPLLGHGLLCSEPLMNHAAEGDLDGRSKDTHPHMLPLAIALGAGVPAALLYSVLVLGLVLAAARRAITDSDPTRAAAASGIAASALALYASNLLDQGLALHTAVPLHLGLLVAAYRFAFAPQADRAPAPAPSSPLLLRLALAGALVAVATDAIGARLVGAAREPTRRRDHERALLLTRAATLVDPFDAKTRLAYAETLDHAGERGEAAAALARLTELLPYSPYPWERLANLEYDRRQYPAAMMALERARRLDPTGPSAAQWALRIGNIHANLGDREAAMKSIAEAVRYDFGAAQRAGWLQDGQKEYFIPVAGGEPPIYLTGVLKSNRDLLPDLVARDPVKARRLATTLVKIEMSFRRYRAAKETIDFYFTLTDVPWLPLEHLAAEIARLEASDSRPDATPPSASGSGDESAAGGEPIPPDPGALAPERTSGDDPAIETTSLAADAIDEFAGVAGSSILYVDRARQKLLAGDPEGAELELARGLAASYDMVAEREAIAVLLDGEVECAMERKDLADAKRATARALYFRPRPTERLGLVLGLGTFLLENGDAPGAVAALREAIEYLAMLAPERGAKDFETAGALARSLLSDPDAAAATRDCIAAAQDGGPGLVLACLAYFGTAEGTAHFQRLKRDFPEWLPAVRAPR